MRSHPLDCYRNGSQTDKRLRESQERFSEVFYCSPDALLVSTLLEGRIIEVNDKLLRVTGCRRDEVIGLALLELKTSNIGPEQSEEQRQQADKMAALGQMAAGIVHDFNNVLHVIHGYSELLLQDSPGNEASSEKLLQIRRAADRGASLIHQLLAFSRKQVLEPVTLDFNSLVAELRDFLQRLIGEQYDLRLVFGSNVYPVKVVPGQFQQVLMNLVVNARDAMPGGGNITIETSATDVEDPKDQQQAEVPPGRYSTIAVTDSGCGMNAETRAHIFERFFTTKAEGTGLGLATVHGIIRRSGGFISVHSQLGFGATFRMFLPAQNAVQHQSSAVKS